MCGFGCVNVDVGGCDHNVMYDTKCKVSQSQS